MSSAKWRPFCLGLNVLNENEWYLSMMRHDWRSSTFCITAGCCVGWMWLWGPRWVGATGWGGGWGRRAWMKLNLLKLNDDKTELLVITSRPSRSQSLDISIKVGDQYISPSDDPPKNLKVIFDSTCSLRDHVANVCRSINFNLYSIGKIRKYLDRPTVEKLVNATITSRLDYCNSLMFGIPKELITQLQMRQNHAARVITQWRKYDHITPVLVDLHWLPVKQRIDFKILLLTYKALNGLAPAYLREQLVPYSPTRTLRSKENHQLTSPRCRLENFGKRSFAAAAPMLWNDLPLSIKRSPSLDIFKSRTKTHLFQLAYFTWLFKCICECLVMLLFHVMYFGIGRFSFCSYATRIFTSALVSKGQISVCNICPILKPALYKYHIIILLWVKNWVVSTLDPLLVFFQFPFKPLGMF